MLNFAKGEINREGKIEPIKEWKVWFQTPFGLSESLEIAVKTVLQLDMNPHLVIKPVAVAFSETMNEVTT